MTEGTLPVPPTINLATISDVPLEEVREIFHALFDPRFHRDNRRFEFFIQDDEQFYPIAFPFRSALIEMEYFLRRLPAGRCSPIVYAVVRDLDQAIWNAMEAYEAALAATTGASLTEDE